MGGTNDKGTQTKPDMRQIQERLTIILFLCIIFYNTLA